MTERLNGVCYVAALWVVIETLREIRWDKKHPGEISPWRVRRLMACIDQKFAEGYTGILVLPSKPVVAVAEGYPPSRPPRQASRP